MVDAAVVGLGSMGAFACLELARRGLSVIGMDRFHPPHGAGSHSGQTRVYREAYAEHPDYVPLAVLAGKLWDGYGREAGSPLLHRCGQVSVGLPESALLAGVRLSSERHGVPVEMMDAAELRRRYPMVTVEPGEIGALEPGAGWVDVDLSLRFALEAAQRSGAELRLGTAVEGWSAEHGGVTLRLVGGERIRAKRLVVCAGAWSAGLLPEAQLPLRVVRKVLAWLRPREEFAAIATQLPVLSFAERIFYTFPAQGGLFKAAVHWTDRETRTDPEQVEEVGDADLDEVVAEAARHLGPMFGDVAEVRRRVATSKTCLYTMTPDEHFVLDRLPGAPVWFGAGFSGHGFKFAPAIGRVLAEMCLEESGRSAPVDFLAGQRLRDGLQDGLPGPA